MADMYGQFKEDRDREIHNLRNNVIDELIDDTAWMDAWANDAQQWERMSQTRKTIIAWLRSHMRDE